MNCCAINDPVPLAQALIRRASVTPDDDGAMDVVADALTQLGFECHHLTFAEHGPAIRNLYARRGTASPNICFAGHTDVVPPGPNWTMPPFDAVIDQGRLFGRGAADMKGAIACFIAAIARLGTNHNGSISLQWLQQRGEAIDACIVGEPTNPTHLGQMMKIGRRGSLNIRLTAHGTQGHVAYPHLADNPIPRLLAVLNALTAKPLDQGTAHFQPSNLEVTTIDVGNPTTNVIPAEARAGLNIRFNDLHSGASLLEWISGIVKELGGDMLMESEISGESFITQPGPLSDAIAAAIVEVTGQTAELSTSGGTSDARFISRYCPVVDFGLVTTTMHKADEQVSVADMDGLTKIYQSALAKLLA